MIDSTLRRTLEAIGTAGHDLENWWIIGSSALLLAGIPGVRPQDVDVLGPREVMLDFLRVWNHSPGRPVPDERFRSYPFARVDLPGCLEIELMGDLAVRGKGRWMDVSIKDRQAVDVGTTRVFIPPLAEQVRLLHLFGRDKDLARAALIVG